MREPRTKKTIIKWMTIFVFITLFGLLNFSIIVTEDMIYKDHPRIRYALINELTGAYSLLAILPFMLWVFERYRLKRETLLRHLPIHLAATIVFGFLSTFLMTAGRTVIYPLAGLGNYDYGQAGFRFLMEYHKQFLGYWIVWGIYSLFKSIKESQQQRLKATELSQQLTQARLQALQMQLNPHFLFNTLNMISSTVYDNPAAADKMIADLSDLLRLTLNNDNAEDHTLEREMELLNLYLEIMKARFGDKLKLTKNISEDTLDAIVPAFILQPIVENAIKYTIEDLRKAEIELNSQSSDGILTLGVSDNGPGIHQPQPDLINRGLGLKNTLERLDKLYGQNYRLQLKNGEKGGLRAALEIPLQLKKNPAQLVNRPTFDGHNRRQ